MIIADESVNGFLVRGLRENGFDIYWILEKNSGIPDEEVIVITEQQGEILITEDKDFGEWVFAHNIKTISIAFLRYDKSDFDQILRSLIQVLKNFDMSDTQNYFITINKNKIRKRVL
jgi:predicted nuclease of predicted toxin-antitoxin system